MTLQLSRDFGAYLYDVFVARFDVWLAFGIVAYAWNFHVMTAVFPWFISERGSGPLLANLLFGVVAAVAYGRLERWRSRSRGN